MANAGKGRPKSTEFAMKELAARTSCVEKRLTYTKRNSSIGAMDELVQCLVCLERMVQPKMLPCQHTFCLGCLERIADPLLAMLNCPKCKVQVNVANGLENLPTNLYVTSILNIVDSGNGSPSLATKCVKCSTVTDNYQQCCLHCKLIFCMVCMSEHAAELEAKFPEFLKQLQDAGERLEYKNEDLERRTNQLNESVRVGTEAKIAELRSMERKVLKEIGDLNANAKDTASDLNARIGALKGDIAARVTNANDADKVKVYMHFHKEISQMLDEVSRFGETHAIFDANSFKLDEEVEEQVDCIGNALDSAASLGYHLKKRVFHPKFIWTKCPKPAGIAIAPWAQELVYIAATDSKEVFILNKADLKVVGRLTHPDMLCPWAVCFCAQRNEIFVSDRYKHCVHVFARNGDYLRTILSRARVISPQGLAMSRRGDLIVCDSGNDRVLIVNPDNGEEVRKIGPVGDKTELRIPSDVTVSGSNIMIVDSGNNRLKIYSESGENVSEIGGLGIESGQFRGAEAVAVGPHGFIFVGDAGNRRIQIFDAHGRFVRTFSGNNPKTGRFKWVSGLWVTPELDIIVADYRNKSLLIF